MEVVIVALFPDSTAQLFITPCIKALFIAPCLYGAIKSWGVESGNEAIIFVQFMPFLYLISG